VKIAAALSGGVDSSVAAALLVADGHEVVGITLQQWPRDDSEESARHGGCCSLSAVEDARRVAGLLGIPYYVWNLEREFGERVIQPFLAAYAAGRTPNPCLRCNAFVRFDLMLDRVRALGFDALATGHYARVLDRQEGPQLHMGADPAKDQSYMLYHLDTNRLRRLVFPLGELHKGRVRELATEFGLPVAAKPDSQEICFVPRGRTTEFLAGRLQPAAGEAVDSSGVAVGSHRGASLYTVGQRTGLLELREPGPWYVLAVDAGANRLVVGRREELAVSEVDLEQVSFLDGGPPAEPLQCEARLRYHAPPIPAVYSSGRLSLAEPFLGPAPGQAAVLYRGSRVLGGGIISRAG
jgi:tRNA-specific 2-thiouridylase